jgi:phosphoglycolate phosphatase-like HAD superfamily hydrolase
MDDFDIWAPKTLWIEALDRCGVLGVCEAVSFSSDCGIVKPSPRPFLNVLTAMNVDRQDAVVIIQHTVRYVELASTKFQGLWDG